MKRRKSLLRVVATLVFFLAIHESNVSSDYIYADGEPELEEILVDQNGDEVIPIEEAQFDQSLEIPAWDQQPIVNQPMPQLVRLKGDRARIYDEYGFEKTFGLGWGGPFVSKKASFNFNKDAWGWEGFSWGPPHHNPHYFVNHFKKLSRPTGDIYHPGNKYYSGSHADIKLIRRKKKKGKKKKKPKPYKRKKHHLKPIVHHEVDDDHGWGWDRRREDLENKFLGRF